jgi:hypothetical protein
MGLRVRRWTAGVKQAAVASSGDATPGKLATDHDCSIALATDSGKCGISAVPAPLPPTNEESMDESGSSPVSRRVGSGRPPRRAGAQPSAPVPNQTANPLIRPPRPAAARGHGKNQA